MATWAASVTRLDLRPYRTDDAPMPGSAQVSVVVLAKDEEPNISRCLASVAWADQVVVVDSGSTDRTVAIARSLGAQVVEQSWLGFSAQREFALRLPELRHHWVYFVDADEWISPQLAAEISRCLIAPTASAYSQRFRLIFQDTWIRHCGWYSGSWIVRLVDRRYAKFDGNLIGERLKVDGAIRTLHNDIVDDDRKGLASWLHKHVHYAELEAQRRLNQHFSFRSRLRRLARREETRPLSRAILKDLIFPCVPAKPIGLFLYMYVLRLGLLDGRAGLLFCFYHAWHETCIGTLSRSRTH
jgi:glycosyltransferase involved in cell wall biosynthesis